MPRDALGGTELPGSAATGCVSATVAFGGYSIFSTWNGRSEIWLHLHSTDCRTIVRGGDIRRHIPICKSSQRYPGGFSSSSRET
ncbi:hypothetical protein RRF57_000580 [Xylaria bambusicola]|uniref:Uncharacterized protein n=1 Tax=Xylaria bambusicola TaxID=326684 RepID=A0AAN7UA09_9PEZI